MKSDTTQSSKNPTLTKHWSMFSNNWHPEALLKKSTWRTTENIDVRTSSKLDVKNCVHAPAFIRCIPAIDDQTSCGAVNSHQEVRSAYLTYNWLGVLHNGRNLPTLPTTGYNLLKSPDSEDSKLQQYCRIFRSGGHGKVKVLRKDQSYLFPNHLPGRSGLVR
jgi:hypothetical protein